MYILIATKHRDSCSMDIKVNGEPLGRVDVKLRPDVVPKTAENFKELCTGQLGFGYAGTTFHRSVF